MCFASASSVGSVSGFGTFVRNDAQGKPVSLKKKKSFFYLKLKHANRDWQEKTSNKRAAPALFLSTALAHENSPQSLFITCVLSNKRRFRLICNWMLGGVEKGRNRGSERGRERDREREWQRDGYSRDGLRALSLLSDGVGVKRLIILKPVGLPGTSRSFPYNIRELDRDHCEGLSQFRKALY